MKLEMEIIRWGEERGILGPDGQGTPYGQATKTHEELHEMVSAIISNDPGAIRDAIGGIVVTLVMQAAMHNMTMDECVSAAWEEIVKDVE